MVLLLYHKSSDFSTEKKHSKKPPGLLRAALYLLFFKSNAVISIRAKQEIALTAALLCRLNLGTDILPRISLVFQRTQHTGSIALKQDCHFVGTEFILADGKCRPYSGTRIKGRRLQHQFA